MVQESEPDPSVVPVSPIELYDSPTENLVNVSENFETKRRIVSDARDIS